jgi:hypothetical protein
MWSDAPCIFWIWNCGRRPSYSETSKNIFCKKAAPNPQVFQDGFKLFLSGCGCRLLTHYRFQRDEQIFLNLPYFGKLGGVEMRITFRHLLRTVPGNRLDHAVRGVRQPQ